MKYKLDAEEKEILKSFEKGEWKKIENMDSENKKFIKAAENTLKKLKKDKVITLRINSLDLDKI